jgi:hypothetical protein
METREAEKKEGLQPFRLRLPGFLIEEEIGLGDLLKKSTYAMGIKPCGGCEKRAETLNHWIHLSP